MSIEKELLPHLRLELNLKYPDLDVCATEGYDSAVHNRDESDNPYQDGTPEARYWSEGWWRGFYAPEATKVQKGATLSRLAVRKAVNEPCWNNEHVLRWSANVVKVASVVAVTVAAIELLDLAS